jgi:glutaredoxin-related protein
LKNENNTHSGTKKYKQHSTLFLIKSSECNVDYNITETRIFSSNEKLTNFISMRNQNQGAYQDNKVNKFNSDIYT